ncbi:MAG: transposase [Ktedonobacteraceae bacterium]
MAQDEGCFGRISRAKRCWAPPGVRPHVPSQVVREYTYVYAAVAPKEGLLTSLILPEASTEMMNLFLEHLSPRDTQRDESKQAIRGATTIS